MSDYLFQKTGKRFSISTIYLELKKIKYSYQVIPYRHPQQKQNLPEVIEFVERVKELSSRQLLSTDESGHPLNLASRRSWGLKGQKIVDFKPSYGTNYSLILLIRNIEKQGIIHWELVKNAVNTEIFTNFLSKIEPRYIIASNPCLNPVEEVFNVIKQYVRKQRPRNEEELFTVINEIVNILQKQDLRKYFWHCATYFDKEKKDAKTNS